MQPEVVQNFLWAFAGIFLGSGIPMLTPNYPAVGWILIFWGVVVAIIAWFSGHKEANLKSIKSAIHNSRCVWAFWYTGEQVLDENIITKGKPTSIKKLILLKPDINNEAFGYITELAGDDTPTKQNQDISVINSLCEATRSATTKVDIYYHSEKLTYTFTIYDKTPQKDGTNLLPKSKNAWIVVQPLEPKRAMERKDWHKWVVKNKGNSKEQFEAYYQLFLDIERRAEQAGRSD